MKLGKLDVLTVSMIKIFEIFFNPVFPHIHSRSTAVYLLHSPDSVDFFNQHKVAASGLKYQDRVQSVPANKMRKEGRSPQPHWLTWNSGTPEPPGLQKRLHKPWPSPEPINIERKEPLLPRRSVSAIPRPGSGAIMPVRPTEPIPDALGSEGVHSLLTRDREQCFTPKPPNMAVSDLRKTHYPLV